MLYCTARCQKWSHTNKMAARFAKCKQTFKAVSYLPQTSHTANIWWCHPSWSALFKFDAGMTRTIAEWTHDWRFATHRAALASSPPHCRSDDSSFWHVFSVQATHFRSYSSQGTVPTTREQGFCSLSCNAPSVVVYEWSHSLSVALTDWCWIICKHMARKSCQTRRSILQSSNFPI